MLHFETLHHRETMSWQNDPSCPDHVIRYVTKVTQVTSRPTCAAPIGVTELKFARDKLANGVIGVY